MKRLFHALAIGLTLQWFAGHASAQPTTGPATQPKPIIEVCFVLDTTGSMGGLIEGAKSKIWSIANEMVRMDSHPQVYIGLVGYRDRGDSYVTRTFDLTDDIDTVFKNLSSFKADGGGDGPESVNQALHEAVTQMHWNPDRRVSKLLFLVGDAPPHMDYADDVKYQEVCQVAVKKDLIINAIQCGGMTTTTPIWQEIARLGEGGYVAIGQTGDMVVTATPYDKELADLNTSMNATIVAYGDAQQQGQTNEKIAANGGRLAAATTGAFGGGRGGAAAAADRVSYNLATGKAMQGSGDLVDDLNAGLVKRIDDLKPEQLPQEMQKLEPQQRQEYLDKQAAARKEIRDKIANLVAKRQEFLDSERKRIAQESGGKDSFDAKVAELIREQSVRKTKALPE